MNLACASRSAFVSDRVVEVEPREASGNFDNTAARHTNPGGIASVVCDPPMFENTRSKPGLNDNYAARRQVLAKTGQRFVDTIEGSQIPDRTEQAHDGVVSVRELERAHVGFVEPTAWVFLSGNAHECGIDIQAIHDEARFSQKPRVLAGATRHVKERLARRIELP